MSVRERGGLGCLSLADQQLKDFRARECLRQQSLKFGATLPRVQFSIQWRAKVDVTNRT
jgi:hypothetical protein